MAFAKGPGQDDVADCRVRRYGAEPEKMIPVTVTLTRFREPDALLEQALDSLAVQRDVRGEVVLFDQDWRPAYAERVKARSRPGWEFRCIQCPSEGLSYARNLGLAQATHDHVLFIDPDAIADPNWAAKLAQALLTKGVAVAGSRIMPLWLGYPPLLARSRVVRDQYSLLDWGSETVDAPRVVGAGFGVNRACHPLEMRFDTNLGRCHGTLYGGEESDLCARVRARGGRIVYVGEAVIHHQITAERLTWRWIWRRLFYAGLGRAVIGGAPSPSKRPGVADWVLLPLILPSYLAGYSYGWLRAFRSQQQELS